MFFFISACNWFSFKELDTFVIYTGKCNSKVCWKNERVILLCNMAVHAVSLQCIWILQQKRKAQSWELCNLSLPLGHRLQVCGQAALTAASEHWLAKLLQSCLVSWQSVKSPHMYHLKQTKRAQIYKQQNTAEEHFVGLQLLNCDVYILLLWYEIIFKVNIELHKQTRVFVWADFL